MAEVINLEEKRKQLSDAATDDDVLGTIIIRRSSKTSVWISDDISIDHQWNWFHWQMREAGILATEIEERRK